MHGCTCTVLLTNSTLHRDPNEDDAQAAQQQFPCDTNVVQSASNMTLKEELQEKIKNNLSDAAKTQQQQLRTQDNSSSRVENALKAEMALFQGNGNRGVNLQRLYEYLTTVPPTSVEAGRAFSAAGTLCTKIRSSLGDESLDALCFMRSYFQQA